VGQRGIALFDIDRTIYDGYVIFPLAEYFFAKGILNKEVVGSLHKDLHLHESKRVDYELMVENLNIHWASGLRDRSPDWVLSAVKAFLATRAGNRFFPFATPLIEFLKKTHDIYLVTVS
jgi:phosphoserine phosphatase